MNTNAIAASPAHLPIAAIDAARKAAGAKAAATKAARLAAGSVPTIGAGAKAAATRAARLARQAEAAAELAAPVFEVGSRARLSVLKARKFDQAEVARQQAIATVERLNRMIEAARLVHLLGFRADGSINRNRNCRKPHIMVTRDNFEGIIARAARSRSLAS